MEGLVSRVPSGKEWGLRGKRLERMLCPKLPDSYTKALNATPPPVPQKVTIFGNGAFFFFPFLFFYGYTCSIWTFPD